MVTAQTGEHLTDGEIVRALDEQSDADERIRTGTHLAVCDACARRLQRVRRRQERLSALLRDADFAVPGAVGSPIAATARDPGRDAAVSDIADARARRRRTSPPLAQRSWVRIAAGILLVIGVALSFTPVQAAVFDWVRAHWTRLFDERTPTTAPSRAPQDAGARIEFTHEATAFRVAIDAAQTAGSITVRRSDGSIATADANRPGVELLVLPAGLRIINPAATDADYGITVPATVTGVTVTVGGRIVARLSGEELDVGRTLPVR